MATVSDSLCFMAESYSAAVSEHHRAQRYTWTFTFSTTDSDKAAAKGKMLAFVHWLFLGLKVYLSLFLPSLI